MNTLDKKFQPVWEDRSKNSTEANRLIDQFVAGGIKVLELFECDPELFSRVSEEAKHVVSSSPGQIVTGDHVTYRFIKTQDPSWEPKPGAIHQYSLYNSKDDLLFTDEDHHWHDTGKKFVSGLKAIPEFVQRYFGSTELQNFRLQTIDRGGSLGQHREKIIGIPKRELNWKLRFHLPCVTNPHVRFLMDGQEFRMKQGRVYLFNQGCMHGVSNDEGALRAHLVWDCYLNEHVLFAIVKPALERTAKA